MQFLQLLIYKNKKSMKRTFLFLAMLLMGVLTFAEETITVSANSEDISQSLDLKVVAKLFAEASTTEHFENMLNNPDSAFSNLDLNGDNQIDYLPVVEAGIKVHLNIIELRSYHRNLLFGVGTQSTKGAEHYAD